MGLLDSLLKSRSSELSDYRYLGFFLTSGSAVFNILGFFQTFGGVVPVFTFQIGSVICT